ncbi:MAG: hypothetical protein Phog2KO_36930 [Phototrophicaceae bacterium]
MTKRLLLTVILTLSLLIVQISAQEDEPSEIILDVGDPAIAERINIMPSETDPYSVLILGDIGSVFPSAQVAIRNLYTGATVYAQANFDGSFSATISGIQQMPYQVNTDTRFDQTLNPENLSGIGVVVHPNYDTSSDGIPFGLGGSLAYGAGTWYADGVINAVDFSQGDTLSLSLDVTFLIDNFDPNLDYVMRGELGFRRYFDENGQQLSTAVGTGNTWSSELTATGLPILGGTVPDIALTETSTDDITIDETTGAITFSLEFETDFPDDLLTGRHLPVFSGSLSVNNSEFVDWTANRILSVDGISEDDKSDSLLPFFVDYLREGDEQLPFALSIAKFPVNPLDVLMRDIPLVIPFVASTFDEVIIVISNDECPDCSVAGDTRFLPIIVNNQLALLQADYENPNDIQNIVIHGTIQDNFQHSYTIQAIDNLSLANFRASAFSGTVFEIDDSLLVSRHPITTPSYNLNNAHIANFSPLGSSENIVETVNDVSDIPYGYFLGDFRQWQSSGEYSFEFPQLFAPSLVSYGVVINSDTPANGVYGLADYDQNPQAWFDTATYPTNAPDVLPFVNFPYFSGDVAFIPDGDNAGINPVLSGGDYQYLSVVRADGVISQFIRDSNATFDARISNDDLLNGRIGAGSEGNRPEDVLWLFGAVVDGNEIRGYSSIAVVTDDASARVVPAFSEALFYDRGAPVDLFVLPTGVRAGQVLETGDTFAMIGYTAPTVSADISTTIVTPSETIINTSQASQFGYFYEPEHDFIVSENGIYRVYVDATYAGETSAGLLPEPVYGTVLGADNSSYLMFVVDRDAPMLTTNRESVSTVASGQSFSINLNVPDTWTDVSAHYVVRTPQWILEQGELDTFSNRASYTFNWSALARLFPSLEAFATAPSDMDEVTLSFAMTGSDENGNRQTQARIFTLRGNILYTADE